MTKLTILPEEFISNSPVILAAPETSSGTVGADWLIPMRPVVVNAVLVVAPEFTRAAPPATSNLTPGVVVPIPTYPVEAMLMNVCDAEPRKSSRATEPDVPTDCREKRASSSVVLLRIRLGADDADARMLPPISNFWISRVEKERERGEIAAVHALLADETI